MPFYQLLVPLPFQTPLNTRAKFSNPSRNLCQSNKTTNIRNAFRSTQAILAKFQVRRKNLNRALCTKREVGMSMFKMVMFSFLLFCLYSFWTLTSHSLLLVSSCVWRWDEKIRKCYFAHLLKFPPQRNPGLGYALARYILQIVSMKAL